MWLERTLLAIALTAFLAAASIADDGESAEFEYDSTTGLVVAPDFRLVAGHCTACHSARIITQQGLTRNGWLELIEWMQEEQGLWPIDDESLHKILTYLSDHYGPDRIHFKQQRN